MRSAVGRRQDANFRFAGWAGLLAGLPEIVEHAVADGRQFSIADIRLLMPDTRRHIEPLESMLIDFRC